MRIEISPSFETWSEQFALGSPIPGVGDGDREPLFADFDGPLAGRLFPGVGALLADLNADAPALGFAPLTAADASLGDLRFGDMTVDVTRIPLGIEVGLHDRLAIETLVPIVRSDVATSFQFDPSTASLAPLDLALDTVTLFPALATALAQLQALVDGGTLTPAQRATATTLLSDAAAFDAALRRRAAAGGFLPLSGTPAGGAIQTRYGTLTSGFTGFGLTLPALGLASAATAAQLDRILTGTPVGGERLEGTVRGWSVGEIEVGARLGLLDTFAGEPTLGPPAAPSPPDSSHTAEEAPAAPRMNPSAAGPPADHATRLLRLRTSVGAKVRFTLSDPDRTPFLDPRNFVGQPIGDGQTDIELALYQDMAVGSRFLLVAAGRYGIQRADRLTMRIHPPSQPIGLASQEVAVDRDLGDYFALRVAPRLRLNEFVAFGAEYSYWNKKSDAFTVAGTGGPSSAAPLRAETHERRHRLGVGVYYRTARSDSRAPLELAFVFQTAVAGSGGQTPASQLISASLRFPIHLF
ncbi:MAG: hypothetical protein ACE5HF_07745 [Gemmatimonadota bacterium]